MTAAPPLPATPATDLRNGQPVTLTANPDSDSLFNGWGGDCSGTQPTCTVTLTRPASPHPFLSRTAEAHGHQAGQRCGRRHQPRPALIAEPPARRTSLRHRGHADAPGASTGSSFTGWTGACSGSGACSVTMDQARTVGATFTLQKRTPDPGGSSRTVRGTVVSSPAGINFPTGATSCLVDGEMRERPVRLRHRGNADPDRGRPGRPSPAWGGASHLRSTRTVS